MKSLSFKLVNHKITAARIYFIVSGILILVVLSIFIYKTNFRDNKPEIPATSVQGSRLPLEPTKTALLDQTTAPTQNILIIATGTPSAQKTASTPTLLPTVVTSTTTVQPSPLPTITQPSSTPGIPCNQIGNLEDVTIPSGTQITAGQTFTKTWIFQNTGSCTWKPNYRLVRISGSLIYPYDTVQLDENISPGMSWMISVDVTAPSTPGTYYDTWKLFTDDGEALTDDNGVEPEFSISVAVTPLSTQINGRITRDGAPVGAGVTLTFEDAANQTVATTATLADGTFIWTDVPASTQGYNVVFSQAANSQFGMDQVLSWVWVGPIAIREGQVIQLGDIDISSLGFSQTSPEPAAAFSAAAITPNNPIVFQWSSYPSAADYWVDLVRGEEENVWQSRLTVGLSAPFDGTLADGSHIQPDEYWWAVGARRWLGAYQQVVYTYLTSLSIED